LLITRVELQNIKSYRHAVVALRRGTTAIRGHNGAGKSTLVEAIGWALFDALPYSQAQFIREGERSGQVTVSFQSAEDDREYQVVRRAGTAPLWYVYDPELDHRPAEQRVDVLDFLRRHLRIEGEIALDALFNDALGVPQGALTADFLLTAANRKKKFDALLQVEDFSRAAEKLRDTRSYLLEATHTQDAEIARLERETNQLDAWRADLAARGERERALVTYLTDTQRQHHEAAALRDTLLAREREVRQLEGARDLARVAWEAADRAAESARAQMQEAREADRVCAATRADHETHVRVEAELAAARRRAQTRDYHRQQKADLDKKLGEATHDAENARHQLDQALEAERRVVDLSPLVAQQLELLRRREELKRDVSRLQDARTVLASREADAATLARDIAATQAQIATIEAERPIAELLAERRARVDDLRAALATRVERERRLQAIATEVPELMRKRAKAADRVTKAAANVEKLLATRELVDALRALEAEHERLRGESDRLQAMIAHHEESRAQSIGGQCPFLREPCLNIRQRGMSSLDTYFDQLIERDAAALVAAQERIQAVQPDLQRAREAAQWYARLEEYQERHAQEVQQLAEQDERLVALTAERDELTASLRAIGRPEELHEAQALLDLSDQADRRLRELGPLQEALVATRSHLATAQAELERTRKQVVALAAAPEELHTMEAALAALGDPQGECARAEGLAAARPALDAVFAQRETARQSAAARLAVIEEALKPFDRLDREISALEKSRAAAAAGHTRFLQHTQVAQRLPEHRATLAAAEHQTHAAAQTHERAAAAYDQAHATFDAEALRETAERASELQKELSRAAEELKHLQEQIANLRAAIAQAESLLSDLAAARTERATLLELSEMLDQFRGTIKEAGPYVMRALLRQISTEANRIFGEIMGDRSAQLSWEDDYEVVLRRSGQERQFAQLSGGEQMSAALAVRLALLRDLSRLDIAFFDEPTQNMDGERRANLAEQLRRVHGFDQLVVISHDDTFEQGLDSVLHVEKRGGETVLVEADALVEA
jgi:DNA repair protein SbcC/Rad50